MKTRFYTRFFFLSVTIFCVFGLSSSLSLAQIKDDQFTERTDEQSVLVEVLPENPQPGQTTSFTVSSFLSDLERSTISWIVNGRQAASGVGLRKFSTTMGPVGSNTRVDVNVVTDTGTRISKSFTFVGANVDLIYEADSYTPAFYKGKALLTQYQYAKVVAVPQLGKSASSLSPSNLIYTWKKDGKVLGSLSGYGKSVLQIDRSQTGRNTEISVVVSTADGSVNAEGRITLAPVQPKLLSYIYSPAFGILMNNALIGTYKFSTKEVSVAAVPFYFSTSESSLSFLDYVWMMNNKDTDTLGNIFTVRNEASTTLDAVINVSAKNEVGSTLQKDSTSFTLSF